MIRHDKCVVCVLPEKKERHKGRKTTDLPSLFTGNLVILSNMCGLSLQRRLSAKGVRQWDTSDIDFMILDYLISFIPWLPALSSFSWGPLCRQMCTHKHTTTVKLGSYLNTDSFLKPAHMKHFAFFRFDLWVWIFTGVQWKKQNFTLNLIFSLVLVETEASIVLFMLRSVKLCQLDTWFLSVPVRTPSIPDHSCYVGSV